MTRRRDLWLVTLLTLLAFALRVIDLNGRSLWGDEGITLLRLTSLPDSLSNVEFIFRFFSLLFGVLLVPLIYVLGRRMFNASTALLAAALVAFSPGLLWYSREIRMYSLVPFLSALMMLAAMVLMQKPARIVRGWAGWIVVAALSLLTHYTFAGLIVGQGVLLVAFTLAQWRKIGASQKRILLVASGVLAVAMLAVLATPLVQGLVARLYGGKEMDYSFVPLDTIIQTTFSGFLLGLNAFDFSAGAFGLLAAVLSALAVLLPVRRSHVAARALLLVSLLSPVLLWFAISFLKPNYQGFRHLILITPAIAIALARVCSLLAEWMASRGQVRWGRIAGGGLAAGLLLLQGYGLNYTFARTPEWQDDWRGLAYYVRDHWQPGDLLIVGGLPTVSLPITPYLRGMDWLQENSLFAPSNLPEGVRRVWYVDRGSGQPRWLAGNAYTRNEVNFPSRSTLVQVNLLELTSPVTNELPIGAVPTVADSIATTGDVPWMTASQIHAGARLNPQPNLNVSMFWQHAGEVDAARRDDVSVSVRLVHDNTVWLDARVPAGLENAPETWAAGTHFRTDHQIPIQLGLPRLPYQLEMTVYAGEKQEPVQRVTRPLSEDELACCVRVTQWPVQKQPMTFAAALAPQPLSTAQPARINFPDPPQLGDVKINTIEHPETIRPGEMLPMVLTWQPAQNDTAGWQTELRLEGLLGGEVSQVQRDAGVPAFPPPQWPANEPVRDPYALQIPYSAAPGLYRLSLLRWRDGAQVDGAPLGFVRIENYPRTPVTPNPQYPANGKAGEIALLGYSMDGAWARGETRDVFTHWRADATPARDGVLFLHVIGPDGALVSQDDNPPLVNGMPRSTLTYRAGDGIDQLHRIALKPDLPAGEYTLYAGIYDREGGARWPAQQDGAPAVNDLVKLGTFTLP